MPFFLPLIIYLNQIHFIIVTHITHRMSGRNLRPIALQARALGYPGNLYKDSTKRLEDYIRRARLYNEARLYDPAVEFKANIPTLENVILHGRRREAERKRAEAPITVYYGEESEFKQFHSQEFSVDNASTLRDLWDAYLLTVKKLGRKLQPLHWMKIMYETVGGTTRYVMLAPEYLEDFKDFKSRVDSIQLGEVPGSDKIDTEQYELKTDFFALSWFSLTGRGGRPRFIFAKCQEVLDEKEETYGCLYRVVRNLLTQTELNGLELQAGYEEVELGALEEASVMRDLLAKINIGLTVYLDFPDDYNEVKYPLVKIDGKRYQQIIYSKLKTYLDSKITRSISIIYGDHHYDRYNGIGTHEVYEDACKNLWYRPAASAAKMVKVERNTILDNAHLMKPYQQNVVSYDMETIFDQGSQLQPYSISWSKDAAKPSDEEIDDSKSDTLHQMCYFKFGDNCVSEFLKQLKKTDNNQLYCLLGYNSSRFDNLFLIPEMIKMDMLDDVFYQKNSALNIKWRGRHTSFDLCRYTMSKLSEACEAFKTTYKKMAGFDHNVIQAHYNEHQTVHSFFHSDECENECKDVVGLYVRNEADIDKAIEDGILGCKCPKYTNLFKYNLLDVLCTKEMYNLIEEFLKKTGIVAPGYRAFDTKTIGSAIYKLFERDRKCKLPSLNLEQYSSIRGGLAAGRTQCYKGPSCDFSMTQEYRMVDVKSLYPYIMLFRLFPCGELVEMTYDECISKGLIGFFNCRFSQTDLRVNILPKRSKDAPLNWNYKGEIEACISTVDIQCLIRNGATIHEIKSGMAFTETIPGAELFKCIDFFKKVKEEEDAKPKAQRNGVRRNMAKLFMNSLSGKVIENLHLEKTEIVRTQRDIDRIMKTVSNPQKDMSLEGVFENNGLVSYKIAASQAIKHDNRPIYLGCLIYAYAREHMYESVLRDYDVIYQDTDSALLTKGEYERLCKEKPHLIGEQFGQFALEDHSEEMVMYMTISPKNYFVLDKNWKLIKKGFKGVRLDSGAGSSLVRGDKFIGNPEAPELSDYIQIRDRNDGSREYSLVDDVKSCKLYNSNLIPTVSEFASQFMDAIKHKNEAYVLCSSLRRCIKSTKDKSRCAGLIYQTYILKRITSHSFDE